MERGGVGWREVDSGEVGWVVEGVVSGERWGWGNCVGSDFLWPMS